ncbi:hypothetical protein [Acidianus manzaensis]|uniref:Uncharacterized protein n=1 Tax=Acidianus manzaensis TaxID=282676 RepID=A0A1W6JWY7_9CREN|nr:hypothetical protein [Acidianus manzaensis]ARM74759.1 hypothetical protein B6F84_01110 [Acidianus manzaensis]
MKAIIPIGSPIKVFETAVTTILRTAETYTDNILILYPPFTSPYVKDIIEFLSQITSLKIEIKQIDYRIKDEEIDKILSEADLLIPSASSVIYIIKLVERATKLGIKIDHIMFPFGAWYTLYYPFIPRFIVPFLSGKKETKHIVNYEKANKSIDHWLKGRELSKIIAKISLEFNAKENKNYSINDEVNICIGEDLKLKDDNNCLIKLNKKGLFLNDVKTTPKEILEKTFHDTESLPFILGFYNIKAKIDEKEYDIRELLRKFRGIVIDTNLIYNGIVFYPDIQTYLPYCAYIEIANNKSSFKKTKTKQIANDLAWIYVQELMNRSTIIPTPVFFCDAIIPMIDPLLIKDTLILTSDQSALNHWKNVITNATVGQLVLEEEKDFNDLSFSFLLLYWILKEYNK